MVAVRTVTTHDVGAVRGALVRAFHDDPVMRYMLPRDARFDRQVGSLFEVDLKKAIRVGEATTSDTGAQGGAIWWAPGRWRQSGLELLHAAPVAKAFGRDLVRALRLLAKVEEVHPEEPHWYLAVLGTAPEHQGKGVGSALLQPVLDRCDHDGVAAYLESSKESNIPFYRRHGFQVTGEVVVGDGGPRVWPMWRDPR